METELVSETEGVTAETKTELVSERGTQFTAVTVDKTELVTDEDAEFSTVGGVFATGSVGTRASPGAIVANETTTVVATTGDGTSLYAVTTAGDLKSTIHSTQLTTKGESIKPTTSTERSSTQQATPVSAEASTSSLGIADATTAVVSNLLATDSDMTTAYELETKIITDTEITKYERRTELVTEYGEIQRGTRFTTYFVAETELVSDVSATAVTDATVLATDLEEISSVTYQESTSLPGSTEIPFILAELGLNIVDNFDLPLTQSNIRVVENGRPLALQNTGNGSMFEGNFAVPLDGRLGVIVTHDGYAPNGLQWQDGDETGMVYEF